MLGPAGLAAHLVRRHGGPGRRTRCGLGWRPPKLSVTRTRAIDQGAASSAARRLAADVTDHSAVVVYIDADRGLIREPAEHYGPSGLRLSHLRGWL